MGAADFRRQAEVPAEIEWVANIDNPQTRRAYENSLEDFMKFTGIERPDEFREITRAHNIPSGEFLNPGPLRLIVTKASSQFEDIKNKLLDAMNQGNALTS